MPRPSVSPHLYLLAASLIWGGSYVIGKGLMPGYFTPIQIIPLRVVISLGVLTLLTSLQGMKAPLRRDLPRFALAGLLGVTINQTLFFIGLNLSRPVEASIIHTTGPVWVLLFALVSGSEHYDGRRLLGIMLGLAGAAWMVSGGGQTGLSPEYLYGNLILLANIFSYGLYLVIIRPLAGRYHPLLVMQWVFLFGALGIIPYSWNSFSGWDIGVMDAYAWFAITYVVLGATLLAFLLVTIGLRKLPSSTAAYYNYLQPLIAAMLAWWMRGERPGYIHAVAAVLIFTGVYLVSAQKTWKEEVKA
ncbi:MAG TPA: DMT family transporter [Bacteroidales bacterium]|nr:DMT family transporter [Bacteroidales bacterium]